MLSAIMLAITRAECRYADCVRGVGGFFHRQSYDRLRNTIIIYLAPRLDLTKLKWAKLAKARLDQASQSQTGPSNPKPNRAKLAKAKLGQASHSQTAQAGQSQTRQS
jgi:hypothetical protein